MYSRSAVCGLSLAKLAGMFPDGVQKTFAAEIAQIKVRRAGVQSLPYIGFGAPRVGEDLLCISERFLQSLHLGMAIVRGARRVAVVSCSERPNRSVDLINARVRIADLRRGRRRAGVG